ncbi:MAG: hypothetical protein OER56_00560 [Hyphomicrobiales bacterium]|nr:hypothetical protein [Hyphomicrobiales bacterium]
MDILIRAISLAKSVVTSFTFRRDSFCLDSVDRLETFVATRSAFISQKKLYGYLKERIGTRWPTMFEDDVFRSGINIAATQVFAACLSDFTIHAVAHALADTQLPDATKAEIARNCFARGLQENNVTALAKFDVDEANAEFDTRLEGTDWNFGALLAENFTRSPAALLRWAPIAQRFKNFDAEIVENSVKFAWVDIRAQFARRLDAEAIAREVADMMTSAKD